MYLHLGQETVINSRCIIGIFDMETATVSKHTRIFLAKAEKAGHVFNVSYELPKSFVLTDDRNGETVYISQLGAGTLLKRTKITKGDQHV